MLAFEDRLHGPRWESRRSWVASVTRAEAVDAPGWGDPEFSGVSRAVGLSRTVSVA